MLLLTAWGVYGGTLHCYLLGEERALFVRILRGPRLSHRNTLIRLIGSRMPVLNAPGSP